MGACVCGRSFCLEKIIAADCRISFHFGRDGAQKSMSGLRKISLRFDGGLHWDDACFKLDRQEIDPDCSRRQDFGDIHP